LSKEETLERELNTLKKDVIRDFSGNREYDALKLDLETEKNLYLAVSQRLAETTLTEALTTNNVRVVERALESKLVPRNLKKILFIIFVGLGLGVGLAFMAEYLDRKFKSTDEVERYLGIPFLGFIPHHELKDHTGRPITLQAPRSNASEAYRTLRTWLDLSSQTRVKSLLITSATAGEGKSTTAVNLAISFAQLGRTVLLVDTDLRRPALHRLLRSSNTVGLTDILVNGTDWRQVIQDTDLENLKFLPSGAKPPNPAELLSTKRMKIFMGSMHDGFDLVIYDSPVVLSIPEVPILASDMDGVLLIHYPAKGDKEMTLEAKRIVERTGVTILGIVLNNVKKKEVTYFYSYRYQAYYSYHAPGERQEKTKDVKFTEMIPTQDKGKWVPESTGSRASETTASTKVEKTSRAENFEITIHEILFKHQIGEDQIDNGLCFLILDLSLFNHSEFSYTFNPDLAVIYIDEQNKYDRAIASLVEIPGIADEGNSKLEEEEVVAAIYQYNPMITGKIEEGIVGEEVIAMKSVKRGFLVYTAPMEIDKYTFSYYSDDIKMTIPLQ
jgi:capsular exopolysaccharide synthesis family protein